MGLGEWWLSCVRSGKRKNSIGRASANGSVMETNAHATQRNATQKHFRACMTCMSRRIACLVVLCKVVCVVEENLQFVASCEVPVGESVETRRSPSGTHTILLTGPNSAAALLALFLLIVFVTPYPSPPISCCSHAVSTFGPSNKVALTSSSLSSGTTKLYGLSGSSSSAASDERTFVIADERPLDVR